MTLKLWDTTNNLNIEIIERFQSKFIRAKMNAPWLVRNTLKRNDLSGHLSKGNCIKSKLKISQSTLTPSKPTCQKGCWFRVTPEDYNVISRPVFWEVLQTLLWWFTNTFRVTNSISMLIIGEIRITGSYFHKQIKDRFK